MKHALKNIGQLLLAGSLALLTACGNGTGTGANNDTVATTDNNMPMNDTMMANNNTNADADVQFVSDAVAANLAEIAMHKAAGTHAVTADVKAHAQHMLTDHNKLLDDLKAYASKKGYSVPTEAPADKKEELDKMNQEKKGQDWDKEYLDKMEDDHEKDISKFEKAEKDVQDSELKSLVSAALPTLRSHLAMVEEAQKKMK